MWKMYVKNLNTGNTWEEEITEYDVGTRKYKPISKRSKKEKAEEQANYIIDRFNATLRYGEAPREMIGVFKED